MIISQRLYEFLTSEEAIDLINRNKWYDLCRAFIATEPDFGEWDWNNASFKEDLSTMTAVLEEAGINVQAYKWICGYQYYGRKDLTSFYVVDGTDEIHTEAFANCPNLEMISIPRSISFVGEDILKGSDHVKNFIFRGTKEELVYCDNHQSGANFEDAFHIYGAKSLTFHCDDGDYTL